MFIYVYIQIYVYIYIYINMYINMYTYTCIHMYICIYMWINTYTHKHTHTHTHTNTHLCVYIYTDGNEMICHACCTLRPHLQITNQSKNQPEQMEGGEEGRGEGGEEEEAGKMSGCSCISLFPCLF